MIACAENEVGQGIELLYIFLSANASITNDGTTKPIRRGDDGKEGC